MSKRAHTEKGVPSSPLPRPGKRAATGNKTLGLTQQSSLASIKSACWSTIRERMAKQGAILSAINEKLHHHITDGIADDPDMKGLLLKLLAHPISIQDEELARMFTLRVLSKSSIPAVDIERPFYVRSCTITAGQLRQIVEDWKDDFLFFEEGDLWVDYLNTASVADTDSVSIRYVGMTVKGFTGYSRSLKDLQDRRYGMLSAFCNALATRFPEVLIPPGCWKVYEFSDANIGGHILPGEQPFSNTRERVLVALLGGPYTLNRQIGGYYHSYKILDVDAQRFTTLHTSLFQRVVRFGSVRNDPYVDAAIKRWAEALYRFATENPEATKTDRIPLPDDWLTVNIAQATPIFFAEHVLFALVGKDITHDDFTRCCPFFSPHGPERSRTAALTTYILSQLHTIENGFRILSPIPFHSGMFPLVNLFPWIGQGKVLDMIGYLRQYFAAARPLIAIGMGYTVCSVMKANFLHQYGMRQKDSFLKYVGVPTLQYRDTTWLLSVDKDAHPDPESAFILIPHIHPGRDKYYNQPESLRRVLVLTWMLAIAMGELSAGLLQGASETGATHLHVNRETICRQILEAATRSDPMVQLQAELDHVKAALRNDWKGNVRRDDASETKRQALSDGAERRISRYGFAEGLPKSEPRREQTLQLWRLGYPDLRIGFSDSDADKEKWLNWANSIEEGRSYFSSFLATKYFEKATEEKPELLTLLPGENLNREEMKVLMDKLEQGAMLRNLDTSNPDEALNVVRLQAFWPHRVKAEDLEQYEPHEFVENLQNQKVKMNRSKIVTLYWKDPNGKNVKLELRAPLSTPASGDRFVRFEDIGIALFDASGKVFLPATKVAAITWPLSSLAQLCRAADIKRCWESQTGKRWPSVASSLPPAPGVAVYSAAFYGQKRRPPPLGKKKLAQYTSRSIVRGDAAWLIKEFLDERFPDGGKVFAAPLGTWPEKDAEHIRLLLSEFVERPLYYYHPFRSDWLDILNDARPQAISIIKENIHLCRPITWTQRVMKDLRSSGRGQLGGKYWHFGARM
ncbi:hypothetical protein BZA05DRAFT_466184 [Tricharina praecox]|uniref:uncharacterized protein n=1 Tax=Tricharina praecox TaxID=43433 RepID=UPI002220C560|nr:uncharacterized protein BZA05DRAFT_466184 [Tricharina praecox]KAI5855390.1 hypothetical protein BZA05DRAFT_466184 [Tricharina praecox]